MPIHQLSLEMQPVAVSFNQLAKSLSYQEKLRKQFSNDLAHEFRTPIATVRSQIEAFQDEVLKPTPERLNQCNAELIRLGALVDDLEKLMAAENPELQLDIVKMNAQEKLLCMKDQFTSLFLKKDIRLQVEDLSSPLLFNADEHRFMQIFSNLTENALKYTPNGGSVEIGAYEKNQMVHFYIKDTGIGISEDDLPHVFERFYRGEKSRSRKTGGVGIGLSIVKALIQAQKGKVRIESSLSKGTRVVVSFPRET